VSDLRTSAEGAQPHGIVGIVDFYAVTPEGTTPEMMFHLASLYQLASIILYNFGGHSVPTAPLIGVKSIAPGTGGKLLSVYAVNSAFALELYLKCLLVIAKKPVPRDHRLTQLFADLDDATKAEIRAGYESLRAVPLTELCVMGAHHGADGRMIEFDSCLDESSRAFMQWRYLFENPTSGQHVTKTYSASPVSKVVRELLIGRNPSWERHLVHFDR
jgi:hypothetical protein